MKSSTQYVCTECNHQSSKWLGKCPQCGAWNSFEQQEVIEKQTRAAKGVLQTEVELVNLSDVEDQKLQRIETGFEELDLTLGGGLVQKQVLLLSGDPGVGKSTLVLQTLVNLQEQGQKTLYVSGEESVEQVAGRAKRLFSEQDYSQVQFSGTAGVQSLLAKVEEIEAQVVVVDSVQTVYDEDVNSLPGSLSQVKAATSALVQAAKHQGFILILIGHINKSGSIAGPKALEHLVDTVLQFEGDLENDYRLLRVLKNRFGPTGEVGLLLMTEEGLEDISGDTSVLAGEDVSTVGAARTLALEGNRAFLVQVQALTNHTVFAYPKRVAEGIPISRLHLICAILDRFANTQLGDKDVYVRTAGGYKLNNPISDLAVAAAILSSLKEQPIEPSYAYVGELTLGGRVLTNKNTAAKFKNLRKLGIQKVISSKAPDSKGSVELISSLRQLLQFL